MKISHDASAETAQRQPVATRSEQSPGRQAAVQSSDIDRSPHLLAQRRALDAAFGGAALQRQADGLEDDEPLQARMKPVAQLATFGDEDELPLQGRFEPEGSSAGTAQRQADMLDEEDEPPLQAGSMDEAVSQRMSADDDDEALLQGRFEGAAVQRMEESFGSGDTPATAPAAPFATLNQTGMPNQLKAGIESLSGMDMSDVRVHRNSDKPAQLNALAYAQGNEIHLGPGQEQHLPHEAWHVVQQRQGRVRETVQMAGVGVNDEVGLEREADLMGGRADLQAAGMDAGKKQNLTPGLSGLGGAAVLQEVAGHRLLDPPANPLTTTIQGFFQAAVLDNYASASAAWANAHAEVVRFDNQIDTEIPGRWTQANATLVQIDANALLKSNRARGTMAGEAYETREWRVEPAAGGAAPPVYGPGGGAGIDIFRYMPGLGGNVAAAGNRAQTEIKTAQTAATLQDGLHNGGALAHNSIVKYYYHGADVDVIGLINFVRGGVNYTARALIGDNPDQNEATINCYRSDGTTLIRNFRLTW